MNSDPQRNKDQDGSAEYLSKIADAYFFDRSSGLYKPKTYKGQDEVDPQKEAEVAKLPKPLWVQAKSGTDYAQIILECLGLFIGALTFVLLGLTVFYAHKQWREMHDSVVQSTRAADEAHAAVGKAGEALIQSKKQFVQDERPYLWNDEEKSTSAGGCTIDKPGSGSNTGKLNCMLWFKNFGKSPAIKVHSFAYISIDVADPMNDIHWDRFPLTGGAIYPPNGFFFKNARSKNPVDPSSLRTTHTANPEVPNLFAIHVLIEYFDQSGTRYTSEMCELQQANGVTKICDKHNEIR
jgi:hypothetical protein